MTVIGIIIISIIGIGNLFYHNWWFQGQSMTSLLQDCENQLKDCKGELEIAQNEFGTVTDWGKMSSGSSLEQCRNVLADCKRGLEAIQQRLSPVKYVKRFGGPGREVAYSIQQTTDGGYIAAGATDYGLLEVGPVVSSFDFDDVYLLKIDADGNKGREKTYKYDGYSQNGFEGAFSVQQTSDGGYIIAGWTKACIECSLDALLIKTDVQGNKAWEKIFGGKGNDVAFSVQQISNGGYILTGWTDSFGAGKNDVYLIQVDVNGNKVWEKTFGGEENDAASSVRQTSDGGYILAGTTSSFESDTSYGEEGRQDIYVIKTNANGEKIWERNFGAGRQDLDVGSSAIQVSDGGYVVVGGTFSRERSESRELVCQYCAYLLKIDASGNKVWDKILGKNFHSSNAFSIQQTSDGKYIIAGGAGPPFNEEGGNGDDFYLLRTDAEGNTLWEKLFGGQPGEGAFSVRQTSNGGYIMVGIILYYRNLPEGEMLYTKETIEGIVPDTNGTFVHYILPESDVYIIKTNELGNTDEIGTIGGSVSGGPFIEIEKGKGEAPGLIVGTNNLGDEVSFGIVHSITDYVEPNEYLQPKLGNKYVIIDVSAINYGPPVSVDISDFTLEDDKGRSYVAVDTSKKPALFTGTLNPFRIMRGYIAYEVPKDVSGLKMIYSSGEKSVTINLGK